MFIIACTGLHTVQEKKTYAVLILQVKQNKQQEPADKWILFINQKRW